MRSQYVPFTLFILGAALIILGLTTNSTFHFVGIAFIIVASVITIRARR